MLYPKCQSMGYFVVLVPILRILQIDFFCYSKFVLSTILLNYK